MCLENKKLWVSWFWVGFDGTCFLGRIAFVYLVFRDLGLGFIRENIEGGVDAFGVRFWSLLFWVVFFRFLDVFEVWLRLIGF